MVNKFNEGQLVASHVSGYHYGWLVERRGDSWYWVEPRLIQVPFGMSTAICIDAAEYVWSRRGSNGADWLILAGASSPFVKKIQVFLIEGMTIAHETSHFRLA